MRFTLLRFLTRCAGRICFKRKATRVLVILTCTLIVFNAYCWWNSSFFHLVRGFNSISLAKVFQNVIAYSGIYGTCPGACNLSSIHLVSQILEDMTILYPLNIWTHNGWLQNMDVTYNRHKWDTVPLIIHVIPFSHTDPGWLMTEEEYFNYWTRNILDVVLNQLTLNTNMTFVWSEVCFLKKWYTLIDVDKKNAFKRLLHEKRFEIVTGGLVMPDEAIVHYHALIEVLMEGHLWLKNELNCTVDTAWSVDSFGHSSTYAYLLKKSGIRNHYIQRTHYALKRHLSFQKMIEFYWIHPQDSDYSADMQLFTHMSPFMLYSTLYSCGPDINVCCKYYFTKSKCWKKGRYQTADSITEENVKTRSLDLLDQLRKKAEFFNHNHVIFMVGDDFSYTSPDEWNIQWKNLFKIFTFLNTNREYNTKVQFSTVGKYLNAAKMQMKANKFEIPGFIGDFFPYSDRSDQYWSGFYSTRPFLKALIRKCQSNLRAAEILLAVSALEAHRNKQKFEVLDQCLSKLSKLRNDLGLYQHHDTITGTSRARVVESTINGIHQFLSTLKSVISLSAWSAINHTDVSTKLFAMHENQPSPMSYPETPVIFVPQTMMFFNPIMKIRKEVIKFYVSSTNFTIEQAGGTAMKCQTSPVIDHRNFLIDNMVEVLIEITFQSLGMIQFNVKESSGTGGECLKAKVKSNFQLAKSVQSDFFEITHDNEKIFTLVNDFYRIEFVDGHMKNVVTEIDKKSHQIEIKFAYYTTGSQLKPFSDKSGAYIFLPNPKLYELGNSVKKTISIVGCLKSSVSTWISEEVLQTTELFKTSEAQGQVIHLTNVVDIKKKNNYELVMRLETPITNRYFFTDMNGYQMQKRKKMRKFLIQGNFYPITSMIFIQNEKDRLTLVTGQCHAASSLKKGSMEVMLDRRLVQDDWRGLNEGVMDNVPVTSKHILILEKLMSSQQVVEAQSSNLAFENVQRLNSPIIPFVQLSSSSIEYLVNRSEPLPCGVELVSWKIISFTVSKQELLITLHYHGFDTLVEEYKKDLSCFVQSHLISVSVFIGKHKASKVYEMNLTGVEIKKEVISGVLQIDRMEIKTWLISVPL